ncbi:sodium-dependent glucose transporter 1 isoform X2 [Xenopus laevis]|uniref:Solute carrier family 60 member 1 n=4 Tax=Xenopus laevis TaxID=8355 RepID=S60A2_XENLA|nr:sodium-dependent glucose transporter 1 [Xenopus laevis]XP_018120053.1 sodium-dependent glucose transporter 1 isoform X2 [Xenopus laevis]Q569T7.1 RecName: Full=Sodium-dependent glucose transporter 1; AltName: Full=Major facilitator superfamily domain-containing protein 4B [Xenopus laevis]AAH92312.1 MGC115096 protein [Xenopus laevis]OCT78157.1 hypothetical protein XELAEV_18029267mg [Xenopus laevis]
MAIAVLGPTFLDLAENVESSVANISFIFVGRSMGYLGGSVLGGILFEQINQHLLLGISMLATAAGLFVVPWCKKAVLLTAVMSVVGMSMGFLDTGGNIIILNTWEDQAGPHIQALHFSFALGAFVAPILAKLALEFLPLDKKSFNVSEPFLEQSALPFGIKKSMLSYIVIGTYILLVSLFLFILFSKSRPRQSSGKASDDKFRTARYHNAVIFLLFLFFFCYVGAEVAYGSYIFTYAITYITNIENNYAAGLNSLFWGVFAAVRGLAICFATCLYPGTMLLLSVIGCTLSSLILVLFSRNHLLLWVGTAVYGASMATTFPSGFSWVQQYTTIGGKSASLFVVGAALGEMAIPASVGYLQGMFPNFPVLMYTALASSTMTAILFPVMYKLATAQQDQAQYNRVESDDRRALLSSSGMEEEDEDEAQNWNEADFETIEMNDQMKNSVTVISEDTPGNSAPSEILKHSTKSNGAEAAANKSPSRKHNTDREKND